MKPIFLQKITNWMRARKKTLALAALPVFGIGFLRLLLALSVVFTHSGQIPFLGFIDGTIAVQSFFIVSGFYMAFILTEKYKKYSSFILNRFLRIFPLYLAVLAITIAASFIVQIFSRNGLHLGFDFKTWYALNPLSAFLLLLTNIFIFGQDVLYFLSVNIHTGSLVFAENWRTAEKTLSQGTFVPQSWTLSLELMFYLIAPFIVNKKNKVILFLIGLGILLRVVLYYTLDVSLHDQWTYRFFPADIVFFLIGIISYRMYKFLKNIKIDRRIMVLSAVVFFLYLAFYTYIPLVSALRKGIYFSMLVTGVPLLFIFSAKSKFDRYIGELSYPIYLSHFLMLQILRLTIAIPPEFLGVVLSVISIMASVLLYQFIVKPFDSFRRKKLQTASDIKTAT